MPPPKHTAHGNYKRADYFEAKCSRLTAELHLEKISHGNCFEELELVRARILALEVVARWLKEHGSKHGMPDEVFATLTTVGDEHGG
jgi:hypothetical protein